jgi:hypothetical protein
MATRNGSTVMSYDLRLDIPAFAYINAQLLSLLQQGGTLHEAKKQLFSQEPYVHQFTAEDVYRYGPNSASLAVSLLFCTIVVPREFLNLPANHQLYQDFDAQQVTKLFGEIDPPMDSYRFVRCLRNSVAHALFSVSEADGYLFYKFWTEREPVLTRASIGHQELMKFISIVGLRLSNAVLAQKAGGAG